MPLEPDVHTRPVALHKLHYHILIRPAYLLDFPVPDRNPDRSLSIAASLKKSFVVLIVTMGGTQDCPLLRVKRHLQSDVACRLQSLDYEKL
jgi:hypothetical protein